jgi:hypothetical protein
MPGWSPPSPSNRTVALVSGLLLVVLLYALLVAQNVLLGLLPVFAVGAGYIAWRLLTAIEAIADALQRLAAARERSATGDD